MDNQRQFLSIALVCIVAVLYFKWVEFTAPKPSENQVAQQSDVPGAPAAQITNSDSVPTLPNSSAAGSVSAPQAPSAATTNVAELIEVNTDMVRALINPVGGVIERLELKKQPVSLEQPDQGYPLLKNDERGFYVAQDGLLSNPAGQAPDHTKTYSASAKNYQLGAKGVVEVPLQWVSSNGVTVTKTFRFKQGDYLVDVEYAIDNKSASDWVGFHYGQLNRTRPLKKSGGFGQLPSFTGAAYFTPEEKFEKVDFGDIEDQSLNINSEENWVAMLEHYFVSAWLPTSQQNNLYTGYSLAGEQYRIGYKSLTGSTIAAGQQGVISSQLFLGPKEQERLKELEDQGFTGLNLSVDYGFLTFIADPLFYMLNLIYSFVGNWGWAIILLTILIKAVFYPLSAASYKSMAGMKKLQPRIQTLKERYKDDRQKFQMEMMALYKQEKINPAGGCLPILIQIPVFIALYWVLLESVEMRQAPFALWWQDLSAPDPYFVLPVLMGLSMFVMQKLNPAPMDDIQKKVMMILPFALTILFLSFPQGLVLYWVVNNILSMAQQWYINKKHAT